MTRVGREYAVESVRAAMLTVAATHGPDTTVAQARRALSNPKVHMLLVTDAGRLLGTVVEGDLVAASPDEPVLPLARLVGRTVAADAPLNDVHAAMVSQGLRRLAVVDTRGRLLGLLCLKRHLGGFCSDEGVAERRRARQGLAASLETDVARG